jgi:hypothetical protein
MNRNTITYRLISWNILISVNSRRNFNIDPLYSYRSLHLVFDKRTGFKNHLTYALQRLRSKDE